MMPIEKETLNKRLVLQNIKNEKPKINSIFIEENHHIEKYFFTEDDSLHELRSASKVLTAMAVGIAIENKMKIDGKILSLDTKVFPLIKNYAKITNSENLKKIKKWTIWNLLTHTTGYEKQMFLMDRLKRIHADEALDYALNYDLPYEPGERYAYNNVELFILSVIFKEGLRISLDKFIEENILSPMDIKDFNWGMIGKYYTGTDLALRHSDFHKVAKLLLDNGKYKNRQIVPESWINEMIKMQVKTPNYYKPERLFPKIGAGYFTFISKGDYVFRDGMGGQYIIMNKKKDLLITIFADEEEMAKVAEIFRGVLEP